MKNGFYIFKVLFKKKEKEEEEKNNRDLHGSQSLKYLQSDPLQRKFANVCFRDLGEKIHFYVLDSLLYIFLITRFNVFRALLSLQKN